LAVCNRMDLVKFWLRRRRPISAGILAAIFACCASHAALAQGDPGAGVSTRDAAQPETELPSDDAAKSAALDTFMANVDDLSAHFEQQDFDADGVLIERSEGEFLLRRPDRYVWRYETPFEHIVVADGETLWSYEVDLEQVTRIPLAEIPLDPGALLSGETAVSDDYLVRESAVEGGRVVELVPFDGELEFRSIRIEFRDDLPATFELVDQLGELTRIEFSSVAVNAGIDASRFEFTPPRGVDVVDWN
jgi:outer membrane lipoprotein carrier protein